ncbi:MAG: zinc-binding dehydrogenase [Acidimicrobiia bacterium]
MRVVVARQGALEVVDAPAVSAGPGQVLVANRACGICGSDLHTLQQPDAMTAMAEALGVESGTDPHGDIHLGHEYCGEVLELGPGVRAAVAPGDLTVAMPFLFSAPSGMEPLGFSNSVPGGYGEHMLLEASLCLPVPNGLDAARASCTEPMAIGLHAVNRSRIQPGESALVVGCGPVGLACIAWLKQRGIGPVVASDFSAGRRALARAMGADEVVDPRHEPAIEAWKRVAGGRPLVTFEAVGVPGMVEAAMHDAPARSRILVVGLCMEPDHFKPMVGVVKELTIDFSVFYDGDEFASTLRAIAEGEIDVSPLLTGRVGLDGVAGAFAELADPEAHCKIVVDPSLPGPQLVRL